MEVLDHLVTKILSEVNDAFSREPDIDEFDIIPMPENCQRNRSPVIQIGKKLGMESWCVKHVMTHCYKKVMDQNDASNSFKDLMLPTKVLLLIFPELHSVWNLRKKMIQRNFLTIEEDLNFSKLVLSYKPKCSDVFSHRKWLLQRYFHNNPVCSMTSQCENGQLLLYEELNTCTDAANHYPNNYYAWSHRIWIIQKYAEHNRKILQDEIASSEKWCQKHVSDHSGLQYRQFLIKQLSCANELDGQTNLSMLLKFEIKLCNDAILHYPGHEALWYHRRFVIHHLFNLCSHSPDIVHQDPKTKRSKLEKNDLRVLDYSVDEENKFITESLNRNKDNVWEKHLIYQYQNWLRKFHE